MVDMGIWWMLGFRWDLVDLVGFLRGVAGMVGFWLGMEGMGITGDTCGLPLYILCIDKHTQKPIKSYT